MKDNRSFVYRAIVGAGIGGGVTSLIALLFIFPDPIYRRFTGDALLVLGASGAIGGAFLAVVLGKPGKNVIVAVSIMGGLAGCVLAGFGAWINAGIAWPSPRPYAHGQTQAEWQQVGQWGAARSQTYTVTQPLETVQRYYEGQMQRHCVDGWEFRPSQEPTCPQCREAECKIRRLGADQFFQVWLQPMSENLVEVMYVDALED